MKSLPFSFLSGHSAVRRPIRTVSEEADPLNLYAAFQAAVRELVRNGTQPVRPKELVQQVFHEQVEIGALGSNERTEFLGLSARILRQVLVDQSRASHRRTRVGKTWRRVSLTALANPGAETGALTKPSPGLDILGLHRALNKLAMVDVTKARIAEARCFAGLTIREISSELGQVPLETEKQWRRARAWLFCELANIPLDTARRSRGSGSLQVVG